ncbi:MAG TPA: hypothetical protein VNA87_02270, partial [Actinomycetota bacterium]|nr:hypothetical protein [Actinomycetota bacterium]
MLGKTKKTKAEDPKGNGLAAAPSREKTKIKLGDLLLQSSAISPQQLDEALVQQKIAGKKLGTLLLEIGAIDEAALAGAIARQQDLPLTDLASADPQAEALALIPESLARSTNAVPVSLVDGVLNIAIADPTDDQVLGQLRDATQGLVLSISVAPAPDIRRTIDRSYRALAGVERHIQEFQAVEATRQSVGTVAEG